MNDLEHLSTEECENIVYFVSVFFDFRKIINVQL